MRRSLLVFVLALAGGVAVVTGVVRMTTPAQAATKRALTQDVADNANAPLRASAAFPRGLPTPAQLLAAGGAEAPSAENTPPASPELPPPDDIELLNQAIAGGDFEIVKAMISSGLPVNTDNSELRAPLAVARDKARSGEPTAAKIVALLEAHGAVAPIVDDEPEEPEPDLQEQAAVSAIEDISPKHYLRIDDHRIKEPMDLTF